MSTIGNTGTPSGSYNWYGVNNSNVMAIQVTMPGAGVIASLSAYFAAKNGLGNTTACLCIWDTSGNLLARTSTFTLAQGSGALGGQAWQTANLITPYVASNGQNLRIGWWRFANGSDEWTENAGGTEYQATDNHNTTPPSAETFASVSGTPSIYATYSPTGAYINTGTPGSPVWTQGSVFVNTGTPAAPVWSPAEIDINTGTPAAPVWTPGA